LPLRPAASAIASQDLRLY